MTGVPEKPRPPRKSGMPFEPAYKNELGIQGTASTRNSMAKPPPRRQKQRLKAKKLRTGCGTMDQPILKICNSFATTRPEITPKHPKLWEIRRGKTSSGWKEKIPQSLAALREFGGGRYRTRTCDPLHVKQLIGRVAGVICSCIACTTINPGHANAYNCCVFLGVQLIFA